MSGQTEKQDHYFTVRQRHDMNVQGVKDIDSFDENGAVLKTVEGELTVEGEGLKIGVLDTDKGVVTISGKVNAVYYSGESAEQKKGFISRIFK